MIQYLLYQMYGFEQFMQRYPYLEKNDKIVDPHITTRSIIRFDWSLAFICKLKLLYITSTALVQCTDKIIHRVGTYIIL